MIDPNTLTDREIEFLRTLKSQGVTAEQASARLEAARKVAESKGILTSKEQVEANLPINQPKKGLIGVATGIGKGLTGLAKGALDLVGESGATKAIGKLTGKDTNISEMIPEEAIKGQTGAEKLGKTLVDIGATVAGGAAGRAGGLAGVSGVEAAVGMPLKQGLQKAIPFIGESLGATAAFEGSTKQELPSVKEAGIGLGLDLLTAGLSSKVISPTWNAVKTLVEKVKPNLLKSVTTSGKEIATQGLERAGFSLPDENLIKEVPESLRGYTQDLINQAKKRGERILENGKPVLGAVETVGEDLKTFSRKLGERLSTTGKAVGEEASFLKKAPLQDITPAYDAFVNALKGIGVKVRKGVLDFDESDIKLSTPDQTLMNKVFDLLNVNKAAKNPRSILSDVRAIGGALFQGSKEITAARTPAEAARKALRGILENMPGKYGEQARAYSELLDLTDQLDSAIQEQGARAPELLRRLFSRVPGKPRALIEDIQAAAEKLGIDEGKDLLSKAALADMIDSATGVLPRQGLAGQVEEGVKNVKDIFTRNPVNSFAQRQIEKLVKKMVEVPEKLDALAQFLTSTEDPIVKEAVIPIVDSLVNLPGIPESAADFLITLRALLQGSITSD